MRGVVAVMLVLLAVLLGGCEGPPGPEGEAGPVGPRGPAGATGAALSEVRACRSPVTSVGNAAGVEFGYEFYKFTDGSVMASCEVNDGAASYSTMAMYKASMNGAHSGLCTLVYDVDTSSAGFWKFTLSGDYAHAEYVDSGSPNNGRIISTLCAPR